jgi:signal transduction histidine kinase
MDSMTLQSILSDRKITYLLTDRNLQVVVAEVSEGIFSGKNGQILLGSSLVDLVPELIGSEDILADILAGKLPRFELPWVNYEVDEGQMVFVTMVDLPFRDSAGQITGLVHLIQDVTELGTVHRQLTQHRNELRLLQAKLSRQNQDLAAANADLRRLNEIKSNFIAMAAHELNTPLSSIVGYVEMLLDGVYGPLVDKQRKPLTILQRSGRRLGTIINELLDVTRIQAERIELVLRPLDLGALAASVIAELRPQSESEAHHLILNTQSDLPFALIDEHRTSQIVTNLVSNAIKYTPKGGKITVTVSVGYDEGFLQLSVKDNGVGISPDDQAGLFKQFFRAESASRTGASGTGLGLFITRSLVELQGGKIWFESKFNQGSIFYVTFPIAGRPTGHLSL